MSVYLYEPYYNFERLFDEFFNRGIAGGQGQQQQITGNGEGSTENQVQRSLKPRMDLHENPESNTVTATFELPGLKKEDVQIDLHNNRLTISAESKISEEHNQDGYAVRERRYGKLSRTLQLPQGVKDEDVKASMVDGVLTVTFPKSGPEAERKKISVS